MTLQHSFIRIIGSALVGLVLISCTPQKALQETVPQPGEEIPIEEAYQKYEQGVFFLDVRTPEEWEEFRTPNSTHIPLIELEQRISELPLDQEIVVVCRSGNRSQKGRDILLESGWIRVSSMAGGLNEWKAAGYPIESGP